MPAHPTSTPWSGRGLPPQAHERVERARRTQVAGSLLSAPEATALASVGFMPVGEAMGCTVQHLGWDGYGCGGGASYGWNAARTVTSGSGERWSGLGPYVAALYAGWHTAMRRLVEEATLLGADGVVDISLTETDLGSNNREYVALGTAVRASSPAAGRATRPFTTDLSGTDVSKLLHAGWVPTGIAFGIAAAVRHDDYTVRNQTAWSQRNVQVDGYTDLVNTVRHDARDQFERGARQHGGEVVLVSSMDLRVWENEPSDGHRDHYAEARFVGTAATAFRQSRTAPPRSLSILPLDRTRKTTR